MTLPLLPPVKPQLALSRKELPAGEDYVYEVKLDGFRCLAFVDGEQAFLQSRTGKPLGRYFPELECPPGRYVLELDLVEEGVTWFSVAGVATVRIPFVVDTPGA